MKRDSGDVNSTIWLLGDSSPPRWEELLDNPLDARHPARHNIWTPVLEEIQRQVFLPDRRRVNDSQLYVRNAVHNPSDKPRGNAMEWGTRLSREAADFANLLGTNKPRLVFTFGSFAYEFARRSLGRGPKKRFSDWTTESLGREFRFSLRDFDPQDLNVFPLLHASIARGRFMESHRDFTGENDGNYFDFVGREIGSLLLKHKDTLNVWIEP